MILNLAERYQMTTLKAEVACILKELPISHDNILLTVSTAKLFAVFEKVSKMMLYKSSTYCSSELKSADDVFAFVKDTNKDVETNQELLIELLASSAKCRNCLEMTRKCKDGKDVTGLEGKQVLRASTSSSPGLVVARKETTAGCGFGCYTTFGRLAP